MKFSCHDHLVKYYGQCASGEDVESGFGVVVIVAVRLAANNRAVPHVDAHHVTARLHLHGIAEVQ